MSHDDDMSRHQEHPQNPAGSGSGSGSNPRSNATNASPNSTATATTNDSESRSDAGMNREGPSSGVRPEPGQGSDSSNAEPGSDRNPSSGPGSGTDPESGGVYYVNYSFSFPSGSLAARVAVQNESDSEPATPAFEPGGISGILSRMFGGGAAGPGGFWGPGGVGGSSAAATGTGSPSTEAGSPNQPSLGSGGIGVGNDSTESPRPRLSRSGSAGNGSFVMFGGGGSTQISFGPGGTFDWGNIHRDNKPKASRRAIARLHQLDYDTLGPNERTCPICYDHFDKVQYVDHERTHTKSDDSNDDDDPLVLAPGDSSHSDSEPEPDFDYDAVSMDQDPPESIPGHSDWNSHTDGQPMDQDQDPEADPPDSALPGSRSEEEEFPIPEDHRPIEMPCGHRFGLGCIREWLGSSNTCPLCRTTVESEDEYLRSIGQQPPSSHGGAGGLFDLLFNQLPNIIWVHHQAQARREGEGRDSGSGDGGGSGSGSGDRPTDGDGQNEDDDPPLTAPDPSLGRSMPSFGRSSSSSSNNASNSANRSVNPATTFSASTNSAGSASTGNSPSTSRHTFLSRHEMGDLINAFSSDSTRPDWAQRLETPRSGEPRPSSRDGRDRDVRHHPYSAPSDGVFGPNNRTLPVPEGRVDGRLRPDLQCASVPLALCVSDDERDRIIVLECGHGYHESCLRMCMRAHGDQEIPNFGASEGDEDGGVRDVWCSRCRRYRNVTLSTSLMRSSVDALSAA